MKSKPREDGKFITRRISVDQTMPLAPQTLSASDEAEDGCGDPLTRKTGLGAPRTPLYVNYEALDQSIRRRRIFVPGEGGRALESELAALEIPSVEPPRSGTVAEKLLSAPSPEPELKSADQGGLSAPVQAHESDLHAEAPPADLSGSQAACSGPISASAGDDGTEDGNMNDGSGGDGGVGEETDGNGRSNAPCTAEDEMELRNVSSENDMRPLSEDVQTLHDPSTGRTDPARPDFNVTQPFDPAWIPAELRVSDAAGRREARSARATASSVTTAERESSRVEMRTQAETTPEHRRPEIRRIRQDQDGNRPGERRRLEEGSTVFLSFAASQSETVSGTVAAPTAEPAVSWATSRIPRITDERPIPSKEKRRKSVQDRPEIDPLQAPAETERKRVNLDHVTKSTLILIVGLILSKLTGQLRQILYPNVFVEKHLTDAYVQGFLIPDFIYELLVGGSIQAAIVPTLAAAIGTEKERKTWKSVSVFISVLSFLMLITLGLAEFFAPQLLRPFVRPENLILTARMARVIFPQTLFMMGAALTIGVINANNNFLKTSFGPALYNTLFALSILLLGGSSEQALIHVGIGVSLSALAYFLFQILLGRREIRAFRFSLNIRDRGFHKLLILAVPILFSSSVAHLNMMVLHGFTKTMPAGAATALNQANSVWLLPYGVFTVAIGQAMLPTLSALIGRSREDEASFVFGASLRRMLFFAIPSSVCFFLLREDLMYGIFIWRFDAYAGQLEVTRLAAKLLGWYSISIVVQGFIYLYNYAFYAMKVTYLPLLNGLLSFGLTLLVGSYVTRPDVLGAEGLSVSYALSGIVTATVLMVLFRFRFRAQAPHYFSRAWLGFYMKLIPMIALMLGALQLTERFLSPAVPGGKLHQLLWLAFRFVVAFGVWFLGGRILKPGLSLKPPSEA